MDDYQPPLGEEFDTSQPTAGELLRRARVDKGLELTDIARDTRIPIRHLTAIEADRHDSLPALPYAIGFVKTFARHVGLDAAAVAARFRAETTKAEHAPTLAVPLEPLDERRVPSRGLIVASLIGVVALVAAVWAYGAGYFTLAEPQPEPAPAVIEAAATPAPAPAPLPDAAPPPADSASVLTADAAPPGDAADQTATADATAPLVAARDAVVLTASEDAWFKVYDAEQTVKMGILEAGQSYTVPAGMPGLKLWTGNAGALSLTVAGKRVAAIGAPKQTVKGVSLDPAALLASGGPVQ